MITYKDIDPYITRTKRKKSNKHQAQLDNISKRLKDIKKKYETNQDKMKPYEDKLQPLLEVEQKLDVDRIELENRRDKILEKYEYEVKNPDYNSEYEEHAYNNEII